MRAAATPEAADRPYRKRSGQEPLPGYRLIAPLGRGGFGEVWQCEAPGGLHKAVKFVADENDPDDEVAEASLRQEFEAFERIKRIRHPFLLTLERVELVPGDLVMVMELADRQLQDRFVECTLAGQVGIPREELLVYLSDAAEVLDFLADRHGLQHLDIKPANLFIVSGRVKVGDFGLVRRHELAVSTPGADRGLTPKYVAPEILHGRVDPRSDQYCLALVYQEMLTGQFPYPAKSPQQMMLQHVASAPDLSVLPAYDRPAVARALSKAPTDRFASCQDFVRALIAAPTAPDPETWAPAPTARRTSADLRQSRLTRPVEPAPLPAADPNRTGLDPAQLTARMSAPPSSGQPRLVTPGQRRVAPVSAPEPDEEVLDLILTPAAPPRVRLARIWSVVPATMLNAPSNAPAHAPDAQALIDLLVAGFCPDGRIPSPDGAPARRPDGTWAARVPVRPISGTAAIRLGVLRDAWKAEVETVGPDVFVVRRPHDSGFWGRLNGKKAGLEIVVTMPPTGVLVGEAKLVGRVFGSAEPALIQAADQLLPEMLTEARKALQNAEDRRVAVRVPTSAGATLYPVHGDGTVDAPFEVRCRDVSTSGVCWETNRTADTAYVYSVFPEIPTLAAWAILVRLVRADAELNGQVLAGRFRTDL